MSQTDVVVELKLRITNELAKLFDIEGVAEDWNQAIERAIRVVEDA